MVTDTRKDILGELGKIGSQNPPLVFQGVLEHSGNSYPICFLLDRKNMLKGSAYLGRDLYLV